MITNKMPYIAVQTQRAVTAVSLLPAISLAVLALAISTFANAGWFSAPDWPMLRDTHLTHVGM